MLAICKIINILCSSVLHEVFMRNKKNSRVEYKF